MSALVLDYKRPAKTGYHYQLTALRTSAMLSNIFSLSVVALSLVGVASAANIVDIRDWENKALVINSGVDVNDNVVLSLPANASTQRVGLLDSLQ